MEFDHPEYISMDGVDVLKIVFDKTSFYMQSLDENGKQAVPNSFTIKTAIPPQSKTIWTQEQVEDIQVPTRGLVVSNLLMAFFFKFSI